MTKRERKKKRKRKREERSARRQMDIRGYCRKRIGEGKHYSEESGESKT